MKLFAPLLAASLALPSTAAAQLYREADGNVVLRSGATALRFYWRQGGAPNSWYRTDFPVLTNEFPGAGVSVAWRTGQDPTQASANGILENPIQRFGAPETVKYGYYARETMFDVSSGTYEVTGFFPDFLLSTEPCDDSIAPNPDGSDDGWRTPYRPGRFANLLNAPSRPVVFEGRPDMQSGLFFVGSELDEGSTWSNRLRRYEGGRIAFKVQLSLYGAAPEAFAGFVFRKSIPAGAASKHDAYLAPGIHLNLNKLGGWEVIRQNASSGQTPLWSGRLTPAQLVRLNGPQGLQVEVKTHNSMPGYAWVLFDDVPAATVRDDWNLAGPHFGFFASAPWGYVVFQNRAMFDVGVEAVIRYSTWAGGIVSDVTVRNAPGVTEPHAFDRANLPAVFLNTQTFPEADRRIGRVFDDSGGYRLEDVIAQSYPIYGQFGWWAGNGSGTAGVLAIPEVVTVDGQPSSGAHVFLKKRTEGGEFVLMVNPLAPEAVTEAREMRFRARWSTSLMDARE